MQPNNRGLLDLVFGIFDRLTTATDSKTRVYNIIVMLIIFFIGFTVYQWEELKGLYKETKFETFQATLDQVRGQDYLDVVQQQLQILFINSQADLTIVYEYHPPHQHFFYNALFFEGALPEGTYLQSLQTMPIDKTSEEYLFHIRGLPFMSKSEFIFFPPEFGKEFEFLFSCPIFNLNNVYSGSLSMVWYNDPQFNEQQIDSIQSLCYQSTRVLGRAK